MCTPLTGHKIRGFTLSRSPYLTPRVKGPSVLKRRNERWTWALSVIAGVTLVQVPEGGALSERVRGRAGKSRAFSTCLSPPKQLLLLLFQPVVVRNNRMKNAQQGRAVSDRTTGMHSVEDGRQGLHGTNS